MDRPHAPLSSDADDDIIELTDIVEKGSVPEASAAGGAAENPLEAQMADLLAGTGKTPAPDEDEFDLDALLQATGLDEEGGKSGEGEKAAAPADGVGDENMDMPDMGEVDALLRDLVAPEQPEAPAAQSAPAPETSAASAAPQGSGTDDVDDLDALLASLDAPQAPPESRDAGVESAAGTEPPAFSAVLEETVSSAPVAAGGVPAAAAAEPEVDVDDLDSLLDSIMNPDPDPQEKAVGTESAAAAQTPQIEDEVELSELDALLHSAEGGAPSAALSSEPASESALEVGEFAEPEVSAEPAAVSTPAAPEVSSSPEEFVAASRGAASVEEVMAAAPAEEDGDDLDALLNAAQAEMAVGLPDEAVVAPLPVTGEPELDEDDPLSGLDELLATAGREAQADSAAPFAEPEAFLQDVAPDVSQEVSQEVPQTAAQDEVEEFPLDQDLGDPLLVGEEQPDTDLGAVVLSSLDALAADIAAMQEKLNATVNSGPDQETIQGLQATLNDLQDRMDDAQDRLEDAQAEMRDLADSHARGLAAAEARISALEAELAERRAHDEAPLVMPPAGSAFREELAAVVREIMEGELQAGEYVPPYAENMANDIIRLEDRVSTMEMNGEKAAAEAAAKVIREEIAALAAEMGQDSDN